MSVVSRFLCELRRLDAGAPDDDLCLRLDMVVHDLAGEARASLYNSGGGEARLAAAGVATGSAAETLEALDDLSSQEASAINNQGLEGQARWLIRELGPDPVAAAQAAFESAEYGA